MYLCVHVRLASHEHLYSKKCLAVKEVDQTAQEFSRTHGEEFTFSRREK